MFYSSIRLLFPHYVHRHQVEGYRYVTGVRDNFNGLPIILIVPAVDDHTDEHIRALKLWIIDHFIYILDRSAWNIIFTDIVLTNMGRFCFKNLLVSMEPILLDVLLDLDLLNTFHL